MKSTHFDIHAHLNFADFDADRETVITRAYEAGVGIINVGTELETSKKALELAEKYDGLYAAIGLHPTHVSDSQDLHDPRGGANVEDYVKLARHPKTVAIGECGLDYYRTSPDSLEKQQTAFRAMIDIANEVNKPLMLHVRNSDPAKSAANKTVPQNAYQDALAVLKEYATVSGNFHFFAGSTSDLKDILDWGGTVSFTGVLTFTSDYDELVKYVPLDRIMSETDCPFVAPKPYRGKRNEPAYVVEVVKTIARIKGLKEEVVSNALRNNVKRVFNIEL